MNRLVVEKWRSSLEGSCRSLERCLEIDLKQDFFFFYWDRKSLQVILTRGGHFRRHPHGNICGYARVLFIFSALSPHGNSQNS